VDNLGDFWDAEVKVTPVKADGYENLNNYWQAEVEVTPVPKPADSTFREIFGGGSNRAVPGVNIEVTTTTDDAYDEIDAWYDSGQDRVAGFAVKTSDQDNSFTTYRDEVTTFLEDQHIYTIEANADPAADEIQRQLSRFENYTVTVHANVVGIPAQGPETPYSSGQPTPPPPLPRDRVGGRAYGGPVGMGQSYIVGEQGPELFVPWTAGQIVPNRQVAQGGGQPIMISVNNYFEGTVAPPAVIEATRAGADTLGRMLQQMRVAR
jgi:hypothetical protein